jgi:predicted nucleotidyltransferase
MNALSLPDSLLSLRVYGSFSRGDNDGLSDVDVLAVYGRRPTVDVRNAVRNEVAKVFPGKLDLAEYSKPRIAQFYKEGHLFAWHLYRESRNLSPSTDFFFEALGEPAPYKAALADAIGFAKLLRTSQDEIDKVGVSLVYEAGLMYLASRNVAICASYGFNKKPDFSRWAIYNVCSRLAIDALVERHDYEELIRCRFVSIRGRTGSVPTKDWLLKTAQSLLLTCDNLIEQAFRRT